MSRKRLLPPMALFFLLPLWGCGKDLVGTPQRPGTHGFRAHVTVRAGDRTVEEFELAVRGNARRKESAGAVTLWDGEAKRSAVVKGGRVEERPFTSLDEVLPGHPLTTGFSDREEAARRGLERWARESDSVLAGHVCWIWRFEDRPDDIGSPSTTYWVAPDLDNLVMRVDRETPAAQGREVATTQLTNVRVGADPGLFVIPSPR